MTQLFQSKEECHETPALRTAALAAQCEAERQILAESGRMGAGSKYPDAFRAFVKFLKRSKRGGGNERQGHAAGLEEANARMHRAPDEVGDRRLERQLSQRAMHWREVLAGDPALARQALRSLMAGPIWFAPQRDGYRLHGTTPLGALWPEEVAGETRVQRASPRRPELIPTLRAWSELKVA